MAKALIIIGIVLIGLYVLWNICLFIWAKIKMWNWYKINAPLGRELGYPECCILEFCNQPPEIMKLVGARQRDYDRYEAACIDGKFTGFIPCHKCATKILSGEKKLSDLIENRNPLFPLFPDFGKKVNPDTAPFFG